MNTTTHRSTRIPKALPAAVLALFLVAGCATAPSSPPGSAEVRSKLTALQSDPKLQSMAPVEIREAESAVAIAEQPVEGDSVLGEHRVYMADRKVEIAKAKAATRYAESQRGSLERERAQARLDARTLEADQARRQVETARSEATASRETAATADRKAQELQRYIDVLEAEATDRGLVLTLGNVLFATGRSDLKPGSVTSLDKLVAFLNQYPDRNVVIEGHTDDVGTAERNQILSLNRAQSVMGYLTRQGIQSRRLSVSGMGESQPVAGNDSDSGRQQNRRVEIIIENPPSAAVGAVTP
jgi:outer membrane protein OmpA-like peptidoglycan-associated protein